MCVLGIKESEKKSMANMKRLTKKTVDKKKVLHNPIYCSLKKKLL